MKFKYFAFFCSVFLIISIYIIIFERKRPVFVDLVSETNKQIDSLRSFKQDLKEASEKLLNVDKKYLKDLGYMDDAEYTHLYPDISSRRNVSLPVVVTYVMSGQEEQALSFARSMAGSLPGHLTVMYNIGLQTYELFLLRGFCNSNHCSILNFDLDQYPHHLKGDTSLFRPLIIQDALRKFGAIFFMECYYRLIITKLKSLIDLAKVNGIISWQSKYPTTATSHPKIFEYFKAVQENFYFVPAVESSRLIIFNTKRIHEDIMYPWVKCVLVHNCILPIGAQSTGCQFNKRPQYRYSGCHLNDASALSIVLGQCFNYSTKLYSLIDNGTVFRKVSLEDAKHEISLLLQNNTNKYYVT